MDRPHAAEPRKASMSPEDVRRCLAGVVKRQDLHVLLDTLHASDAWTVFEPFPVPDGWVLQLCHNATGTTVYVQAEHTDNTNWRLTAT